MQFCLNINHQHFVRCHNLTRENKTLKKVENFVILGTKLKFQLINGKNKRNSKSLLEILFGNLKKNPRLKKNSIQKHFYLKI